MSGSGPQSQPPEGDAPGARAARGPLTRGVLLASGLMATGLGAAGVVVPLLPTTPFLLLAAACFVRSSPSAHRRLLASRTFGPLIAQWQRDRSVPRGAKAKACAVVALTFAVSIAALDGAWPRGLLAALGLGLLVWISSLRTATDASAAAEDRALASAAGDGGGDVA